MAQVATIERGYPGIPRKERIKLVEHSEALTEELRQARRDYIAELNQAWQSYQAILAPARAIWEEEKKEAKSFHSAKRDAAKQRWIERQTQAFLREETKQ